MISGPGSTCAWKKSGSAFAGFLQASSGWARPRTKKGDVTMKDRGMRKRFASGFWMFDTPCTQALWEAVMGENPSEFKGPDRPVESVSWDQCQEFLKRLNERCEGLELKLPSEAQWEYACRAGTETPRYREDLNEIAWYWENSQGETHSVGQKAPNDWGLYDTLGNVYEWCEDFWTDDYNRRRKRASAASAHRVIRGGSWSDDAQDVRAACRDHYEPSLRDNDLGFRCAEFRAPGPVGRKGGRKRSERGSEAEGVRSTPETATKRAERAGSISTRPEGTACRLRR